MDGIYVKDYDWIVVDLTAKPKNPYQPNDDMFISFEEFANMFTYSVLLEDGIYTGKEFEMFCDTDYMFMP